MLFLNNAFKSNKKKIQQERIKTNILKNKYNFKLLLTCKSVIWNADDADIADNHG